MTTPDQEEAPRTGNSIVMYRVGGRTYPLKTVPQCRVCQSPDRLDIEQWIINGRPYAAIAKSLPEESPITARNIKDHQTNGHMPLDTEAMRAVIDEHARVRGISLQDATSTLVTPAALAQTVLDRTYEGIANGYLMPSISNALKAATLLYNIGMTEESLNESDMIQAFAVFQEEAKAVMPPEMWDAFGKRLLANPVLRGLRARAEAARRDEAEGRNSIEGGSRNA